jgi:predicted RNA-binding Zn ribbon-like protein
MRPVTDARNPILRVVGGHPALDLVNTVAPRSPRGDRHDYLGRPAELLAWAGRTGLLDPAEAGAVERAWADFPPAAAAALRAAVEIREATYLALTAAAALERATAMEDLIPRWAAAAARSRLVPDGRAGAAARLVVGTVPATLIPDRLARAAVEFMHTVALDRLRACPVAEGGCGWLFLDHSRNGSRRWCAMADCGAQAKSRRLTERRRAGRTTT